MPHPNNPIEANIVVADHQAYRLANHVEKGSLLSSISFTLFGIALLGILSSSISHAQSFTNARPETNFELSNINLQEVLSGGPPKDGIPPIDKPNFDTVQQAAHWISSLEPVISVAVGDQAKAYPLQIMTWHEIVNDTIASTPITVTFCPLCNASIVFDRRTGNDLLDFGTTGLLRKSDLIMYDRQTQSWWQQFSGKGIVGAFTGTTLDRIPSSIVSFETFANTHPGGKVLNRETGSVRSYGQNPYPGYDDINNSPFLLQGPVDGRLPPMERVIGVNINGVHKIYPFSALQKQPLIEDNVNGTDLLVISNGSVLSALDQRTINDSRTVSQAPVWQRRSSESGPPMRFNLRNNQLIDIETQSAWNAAGVAISGPLKGKRLLPVDSGIHFAFAWLAFNPETLIHKE